MIRTIGNVGVMVVLGVGIASTVAAQTTTAATGDTSSEPKRDAAPTEGAPASPSAVPEAFDVDGRRRGLESGPASAPRIITLQDAHELAMSRYPQLKSIDEAIYQADMGIYQAWTMLMPNLTADASITLNQNEVAVDLPLGPDPSDTMNLVIQDQWAKTTGFAINLTLFNPQTIPLIKMAYETYEKERLSAQIRRNDLIFAVTAAFYQAYAMKEMIRVAEENVEMAREFLRHATILRDAGQGTRLDVNRAELQLVEAEKQFRDAIDSEKQALLGLKALIGLNRPFILAGPDEAVPVTKSLGSLKSAAHNNRIEFKEAALQALIADRSRQHTLTQFLPTFDITYAWSWASAEGFSGSNVNWMLIFGAKWNIFLGGSRLVEHKVRQSQIRIAENNIQQLALDIQNDVEQRHLDMHQRRRNLEIMDRQIALAEENHALVSKQFDAGLVSSLDVINAHTKLASERFRQVYERLLFDLSVLKLRRAIGEYSALSFASVNK